MTQQGRSLSLCFGFFGLFCFLFFWLTQSFQPELIACDVGQGDAFLAKFGTSAILIDSGPNQAVTDCLAKNLDFGQRKLSAVVLSHWDADHVGGFSDIASTYTVGAVFANPKMKDTKVAQEAWRAANDFLVIHPFPGDEIVFPGGRIRFIWSADAQKTVSLSENDGEEENSASVGIVGLFPSFGFLNLGDLECQQELAVASLPLLNWTPILKVSHHGSKFSSCPEFLAQIRPEVALISAGEGNKYGHPDREVLKNLADFGLEVLRTDVLGTFSVKPFGAGWLIWSARRADPQR